MDVDRRDFLNELAKLAAGAGLVFYGVRVNIGSGEHSDEGEKTPSTLTIGKTTTMGW